MSDENLSAAPTPRTDPPPEDGPGGPADVVERDADDLPPVTPDQPRSAQVEDHEVPDGIEDPEELDEEESHVDPEDDNPV